MKANNEEIIIVSNRAPISDFKKGVSTVSIGGLTTALHSVALESSSATWIFAGDANECKQLEEMAPPGMEYKLRPVEVQTKEYSAYYGGYSNSLIWPLFHYSPDKCVFKAGDWEHYKSVNYKFAVEIAKEAKDKPNAVIWIQDYHLFLVAKYLREMGVENSIGFFLHIPFPTYEIFRILPQRSEVIEALLYFDLVGFHTKGYVNNFCRSVRRFVPNADVEEFVFGGSSHVDYLGRRVHLGAFPISIDGRMIIDMLKSKKVRDRTAQLQISMPARFIGLGVDRLDYSKGIPEKLDALELFFKKNPRYRKKVSFIQIAVPSRGNVPQYQKIQDEVNQKVSRINGLYGTVDWQPIIYINRSVPFENLMSYYQLADFMFITPVRDGMNLVAKEFIVARNPDTSLILSELAGAAEQLSQIKLVNPYNIEDMSSAILDCLENPSEQNDTLDQYRDKILMEDVHVWARRFIDEVQKIRDREFSGAA